jgi:hypothetical protein
MGINNFVHREHERIIGVIYQQMAGESIISVYCKTPKFCSICTVKFVLRYNLTFRMAILTTICQLVTCVKRVTMSDEVGNVRVSTFTYTPRRKKNVGTEIRT